MPRPVLVALKLRMGDVEGFTDRGAITVRDASGTVLTLAAGEIVG